MNEHYIEIKKENIKFAGKTKEEKKLNEMIYDLTLEIDSLQQENKELKEQYLELEDKYIKNLPCCNEEDCSLYNHAINTDYVLTEFEKWLEEKKIQKEMPQHSNSLFGQANINYCPCVLNQNNNTFDECLNKLQELKEGKK